MTKLSDIARISSVSVSTVSKALRNSSDLNRETAKRIQEVAHRLGYQSKSMPKTANHLSRFVGIICPEIRSNFYSQVATKITQMLFEQNIGTILCFTDFSVEKELQYLRMMCDKKVSGIFCLTEDPITWRNIRNAIDTNGVPVVQLGINVEANEFDNIFVDDNAGIEYAIAHLVDLGHREIAFIGDSYARNRLEGFKNSMAMHGLPVKSQYICIDYERFERCGYNQMSHLLALPNPPTAVLAQYDEIAVGAMRKLGEKGYHVPRDISIVGMENVTFSSFTSPALTTVAGHIDEMSRIAIELLMHKISDKEYRLVQRIQLIPELLIRETTGPVS